MDNISFQSRIVLTSATKYNEVVTIPKKYFVNEPWTINESVIAENVATTNIYDCSALGLTDGFKALLMHICPTIKVNQNFKSIEKYIRSKIDLTNPNIQGFIIGSKNNNSNSFYSPILFDNLVNFVKQYKIPTSIFRGGNYTNNVAYSSRKDEWIIGCDILNHIDRKILGSVEDATDRIFDEVQISKLDELTWGN